MFLCANVHCPIATFPDVTAVAAADVDVEPPLGTTDLTVGAVALSLAVSRGVAEVVAD